LHLYSVHVGDWKFFVFINGGFYDESEATKRSRFCVEKKMSAIEETLWKGGM
jgi:hypothetical protein